MSIISANASRDRQLVAVTLLSTLGIWAGLQANSSALATPLPVRIATETATASNIETFKESNAINGILCIAACNEFFEAGQASFELEIRNLQNRTARTGDSAPLLEVDPSLLEDLEARMHSRFACAHSCVSM